jgi:hypothetical protein
VINEDEEETPRPINVHDEHDQEEREGNSPTSEADQNSDRPTDPNGSQYDSGNEDFPLDEYEEYMEVEEDVDDDADTVYIRARQPINSPEPGDEIEKSEGIQSCRQVNSHSVAIRTMGDIEDVPRVYRYCLVRPMGTMDRPERTDGKDLCLAAYVTINGVKAYMLFDSGSTTDALSPDFARVANVPLYRLVKPATLQLGCSGS